MTRAWTHWATTNDLRSLRTPSHDAGTGLEGQPLGHALRGAKFVFDPFDAYEAGIVSNPNMIVAGSIGVGKSTMVKMLLERALVRGRKVVVIDPKGEYGALARAHGVRPVALGRDGWCDPFSPDEREACDFLRVLVATAQGGALSAEQHYAISELFAQLASPRPPRLLRALYESVEPSISSNATSVQRGLALTLYRFIHGDLAGLFDGEGEPMGFRGDLVVIDLSAQWSSHSLSIAALSAVGAAQQVVGGEETLGYLVLDEAWALLGDDHALRWLQGSWKLARSRGLSHVLVLHRWSDAGAAGDDGTAQRARALGLLRECETSWLFRQPPDEALVIASALGLHAREQQYLVALPKGVALVRYGVHRSVVRFTPDPHDLDIVDTDLAMRA
ncbi:MAG: helicase HerA domain-containing protein [Acidimicrobiales bacterium]